MTSFRVDPDHDPIARAVAKLGPVLCIDDDDSCRLDSQPAQSAQIHHIGACPRQMTSKGDTAGGQTFSGTYEPGQSLRVTADRPHRYKVEFLATGAQIEFVMLAGQSFTANGNGSGLKTTMDDVEPEVPGGGLQLVPKSGA